MQQLFFSLHSTIISLCGLYVDFMNIYHFSFSSCVLSVYYQYCETVKGFYLHTDQITRESKLLKTNKKATIKKSPNIQKYTKNMCKHPWFPKISNIPTQNQFKADSINSYHIFHIYSFWGDHHMSQYMLCIRCVYFVEHLKTVIEFLWTNKEKGHLLSATPRLVDFPPSTSKFHQIKTFSSVQILNN